MHDEIFNNSHGHTHTQNRFAVIPVPEKLKANAKLSGRGVTIAFLDSGFYPHPDFADRVIAFHDVTGEEKSFFDIHEPKGHHWHGTQTVVTCAGNGSLSDGVYRGLASEAKLVLVKVSKNGRIADASIEKGLRWVIDNREKYDIRVLNMSLGGDADLPTNESVVNQLAEALVASSVTITVAAGNLSDSRPIPPANSPSVITVGGYSDENQFDLANYDLYHSSFGTTADGLIKPELVAPSMFVAAPILPGTPEYVIAETLSMLAAAPNYQFRTLLAENWQASGLNARVLDMDLETARKCVETELAERKIVATHYQHVDGTSFAAPITASVAAQMFEVNPNLTPASVKNILISSAVKLAGRPSIRQGFGVLHAGAAVDIASREQHFLNVENHFPPRIEGKRIVFSFHNDDAESVQLCGDFNGWRRDEIFFSRNSEDLWQAEIPCQPAGEYRYKFLVGGTDWTEDPSHGFKMEDGLGGFNSVFIVR